MSVTFEQLEKLLKRHLSPIDQKLDSITKDIFLLKKYVSVIKRDLSEIRKGKGYDNLTLIKSKREDKEEM